MIPTFFPLLMTSQMPATDMDWMPWMLGIFGAIISALFLILISLARQGVNELRADMKDVKNVQNEHETRLQLVEVRTDAREIAEQILTVLRASGSGGFDIEDFKKRR